MGDQDIRFREACGAKGPLRLTWDVDGTSRGGEIALEGPSGELFENPRISETYLGLKKTGPAG